MTAKLAVYSPVHMMMAPAMPNSEPTRKPMLRPTRCIKSAAGNTQIMTPRCCIVTGRLANSGW